MTTAHAEQPARAHVRALARAHARAACARERARARARKRERFAHSLRTRARAHFRAHEPRRVVATRLRSVAYCRPYCGLLLPNPPPPPGPKRTGWRSSRPMAGPAHPSRRREEGLPTNRNKPQQAAESCKKPQKAAKSRNSTTSGPDRPAAGAGPAIAGEGSAGPGPVRAGRDIGPAIKVVGPSLPRAPVTTLTTWIRDHEPWSRDRSWSRALVTGPLLVTARPRPRRPWSRAKRPGTKGGGLNHGPAPVTEGARDRLGPGPRPGKRGQTRAGSKSLETVPGHRPGAGGAAVDMRTRSRS